jgi:hypothetical protein
MNCILVWVTWGSRVQAYLLTPNTVQIRMHNIEAIGKKGGVRVNPNVLSDENVNTYKSSRVGSGTTSLGDPQTRLKSL